MTCQLVIFLIKAGDIVQASPRWLDQLHSYNTPLLIFGDVPCRVDIQRWCYCCHQARREPQRGPGKHYHGVLSPPPFCMSWDRETPKEGGNVGRCPLTIRLGVRGSVVSSPSRAENGFYAHFRSERSHLEAETPFSVFLSDGGAPQTSWGPGKLSTFPPSRPAWMPLTMH